MPQPNPQLNIVYMHSHDTGRHIEPYGHAVPTPNLMKLASSGVLFRKAFSAAPTCSPSRAALLTGQSAHSSGMIGLAHRGFALHDYEQHLVHTLRSAGYRSTLIGVQHVAVDAHRIGYDEIMDSANHAESVGPAAARWIASEPRQPFFLDIGFFETHREFPVEGDKQEAATCLPFPVLPDTPETRRDTAAFKASARILDDAVGQVIDALDDSGMAENTLLIYTTDHGPAFPAMKCNLTDHGIGVALIMRGPGPFATPRTIDAMISHVDVFPTLCEFLKIPQPEWLTGSSFLPVLTGQAEEINEEIFAEVTYHAAYEPKRAVRTRRHKYIRRFGERNTPVLPNCDDSPSKDVWLQHGWRDRTVPAEQLYDLVFDPMERNSLVNDPAYGEVMSQMRQRLHKWMTSTNDPLLAGSVQAPAGTLVNDPDGLSPRETPRLADG